MIFNTKDLFRKHPHEVRKQKKEKSYQLWSVPEVSMMLTPESLFHKAIAIFPTVAVAQTAVIIIIILTKLGLQGDMQAFSTCSVLTQLVCMWDHAVSHPGMKTMPPELKNRFLNHWTTSEVPTTAVILISCAIKFPSFSLTLSTEELMLLNCGVGKDSFESLGLQGDPTSPF